MGLVIAAILVQLVSVSVSLTYIWLNFFSSVKTEMDERNNSLMNMLKKTMVLALVLVLASCFLIFGVSSGQIIDRASKLYLYFTCSWIVVILTYIIGMLKTIATGTKAGAKISPTKTFLAVICCGAIASAVCSWLIG